MSDDPKTLIPDAVLDAYLARYPHLRHLVVNIRPPNPHSLQAAIARNVSRLASPNGIGVAELLGLGRVANGETYAKEPTP